MRNKQQFSTAVWAVGLVATLATRALADDHVLLTEVLIAPDASEFIELYNPTAQTVALDNYYLSDDQDYALLPGNFGGAPSPNIGSSDFIVRFPAGATIEPNGIIVVAVEGASFFTAFGYRADFEINSHDAVTPDMIKILPSSGSPSLSGTECIALFHWNGTSDLVQDVDLIQWGTAAGANTLASKTNVSVDGPDADAVASTYLPDAMVIPVPGVIPAEGMSIKRTQFESPNETIANGNGITGHDETSENTSLTWGFASLTAANPGGTALYPPSLADLMVITDAPAAVPAGSTVHITLTLRNQGQLTASNVMLTCELPAACSFMGDQCTPPGMSLSGRGGNLTWTVATMLPAVQYDIEVELNIDPRAVGTLTFNIASSTSSSEGDSANNAASVSIDIETSKPVCPADFVTSTTFAPPPDGIIDGADLAVLLGEWGANPDSIADLVTSATFQPPPDGIVDGADLALLLGAWGVCE